MYTVLIDDNATSLFLTERLLLHEGLSDTVNSFQSPPEALAFLLQQVPAGRVPQVILLDLNMPLISGWDFLEMLQRHEEQLQGQCIVYLLTSSLTPADNARAQAHPLVTGFLSKPLNKEKIQQIRDHVP
ncbi:response regulator [Hymenobacter bucti]|uniref:Two-component system response regulator n=1 Tax=Hymenobacter bucti TaxID=1844114 RepID=A0ABW4QZ54_9BACT